MEERAGSCQREANQKAITAPYLILSDSIQLDSRLRHRSILSAWPHAMPHKDGGKQGMAPWRTTFLYVVYTTITDSFPFIKWGARRSGSPRTTSCLFYSLLLRQWRGGMEEEEEGRREDSGTNERKR